MSDPKSFLKHIAGLRGFAIIAVVLFHLNGQFFPNGYLGVDVFLVITGYLLFRSRAAKPGCESILDMLRFFSKRFCRIVPPMAIIILAALLVGLALLSWPMENLLSKVGSRACFGTANIFLKREFSNYFATDASFIPLLHLWYLSIIMQVYLIYALANQALQRLSLRCIIVILTVIGLLSLALCYSYPIHESLRRWGLPVWEQGSPASYYSTLPRLWEVLAGGIVLLLPSLEQRRKLATSITLLSIISLVALALIPGIGEAPGVPCALLTVAATVLLIRYTPESALPRLLSNKPLLWLGGISFSLYLVHMPIISYGHMWVYGEPTLYDDLLILAASVLAGWGFWWCVEKRRCSLWLALALWGAAFITSTTIRYTLSHKKRIDISNQIVYDQWHVCNTPNLSEPKSELLHPFFALCEMIDPQVNATATTNLLAQKLSSPPLLAIGNPDHQPSFVLIGDSHGAHLYLGMDHALRQSNLSGVYLMSVIHPFHNWNLTPSVEYTFTPEKEQALMAWLQAHPELTHVVIAQYWKQKFHMPTHRTPEEIESDLRDFLLQLQRMGKKVILIGPSPEFSVVSKHFRTSQNKGLNEGPICTLQDLRNQHTMVYPMLSKMEQEGLCSIIDPADALQPGEVFESIKDGKQQMKDSHHLYKSFSIWLMERLHPLLLQKLSVPDQHL